MNSGRAACDARFGSFHVLNWLSFSELRELGTIISLKGGAEQLSHLPNSIRRAGDRAGTSLLSTGPPWPGHTRGPLGGPDVWPPALSPPAPPGISDDHHAAFQVQRHWVAGPRSKGRKNVYKGHEQPVKAGPGTSAVWPKHRARPLDTGVPGGKRRRPCPHQASSRGTAALTPVDRGVRAASLTAQGQARTSSPARTDGPCTSETFPSPASRALGLPPSGTKQHPADTCSFWRD